jgi:hypothetical protein
MTLQPTARAKLVSAPELTKVVEEAIRAAGSRTPVPTGHNIIISPDILGRVIRELDQAQHFAQAVSKGVNKAGIGAEPVVLTVGPGINIAGFIERDALQIREF